MFYHFSCEIIVRKNYENSGGIKQKTMHYNYYFESCSLIFLVAIAIAYFSRKKFPTPLFKLFGFTLLAVIVDVSSNIASSVLLDYSDKISPVWCETFSEIFYFCQILCSYLLFAYILYSVGKSLRYQPLYNLTIIPSFIAAVIIFTNPIHHWIFYTKLGENGLYDFYYGPLYIILYLVAGLNIFSTVIYTIYFRKTLPTKLVSVLSVIVGINVIITLIQIFQPHYLLSGVGFTLSLVFAIITVNDPDEKVDRTCKAFNNEAFIDYINNQRTEKQRKHFIIFDIESFGMFNKVFGVVYANELLTQIRRYIESVNNKVFLFRTQSARFVILLRNKEEQLQMVEALKKRFLEPFEIKNNSMNISIRLLYFVNDNSFKNSDSYNDFLNRTMSAMVNYKNQNYIELDQEFLDTINRDRRIKEILENCLKTNVGLYMVYQPIYDTKQKKFNHFEALIRLANEELGSIGPAEFIPIAETFGLASDIDFFVLNETCDFLARNPDIENLEINVSCAEFFNNPSDRFLKTINKYGIDPKRLCLEITETVAVKYPAKTKQFMQDLGQYGIQFAMDDFGSGYSNIARFINLPFSIAKLDKSLLEPSKNIRFFLDSAIQLFKNLDIPLVMEGVEGEEQLELARKNNINYLQGYYFTKPLRERELLEFLKEHNKK